MYRLMRLQLCVSTFCSPNGEMDYGLLSCWGINRVGRQRDKCEFKITQASN